MISNPSLRKAKVDGMSYEKNFELFCNSKDVGSIYHSRWSKSGTGSFDDNNKMLAVVEPVVTQDVLPNMTSKDIIFKPKRVFN